MKVTIELNANEALHSMSTGALQALLKDQMEPEEIDNGPVTVTPEPKKAQASKKPEAAVATPAAEKPKPPKKKETESPKKEDPKPKAHETAVTLVDLRKAIAPLIKNNASNAEKVSALFEEFGAAKLSEVDKKDYPALLAKVQELA